jgi:hypothetical protein
MVFVQAAIHGVVGPGEGDDIERIRCVRSVTAWCDADVRSERDDCGRYE